MSQYASKNFQTYDQHNLARGLAQRSIEFSEAGKCTAAFEALASTLIHLGRAVGLDRAPESLGVRGSIGGDAADAAFKAFAKACVRKDRGGRR